MIHRILCPSQDGKPNPTPSKLTSGTWQYGTWEDDPDQVSNNPNPTIEDDPGDYPQYQNPWTCAFPCQIPGHTDNVVLWFGESLDCNGNDNGWAGFQATDDDNASDPNYQFEIHYNPAIGNNAITPAPEEDQ